MRQREFSSPNTTQRAQEDAAMPYDPSKTSASVDKVQATLMAIDGVEGVGRSQDEIGNEAIVVYTRDRDVAKRVPPRINGMKVLVQVTGPIDALRF